MNSTSDKTPLDPKIEIKMGACCHSIKERNIYLGVLQWLNNRCLQGLEL